MEEGVRNRQGFIRVMSDRGTGASYLDVLNSLFYLVGSKVVVGHQLLTLFDGLLQVGGSPAHLVFEGFVLAQQSQRAREVLPIILGGEDLLLLPDPPLLQSPHTPTLQSHLLRAGAQTTDLL